MSTVSVMSQIPLIEALAGSSDLYTFIPSDYGSPWTEKEFNEYPKLAFLKGKEHVADRAKELGVPFTPIKAAAFPEFAFTHP